MRLLAIAIVPSLLVVLPVHSVSGRGPAPQEPSTATAPAEPSTQPAAAQKRELTVAILDFSANSPGAPELGSQIGEVLTAMLSGEPGFTLVDRATLARTLQEHELNLSGVVDTDKAVQIGKLVGARILVTGKAFPVGSQLFLTAKLIGTETSLVEGVLVKGKDTADVSALIVELAERVAERLRQAGPKLVADDEAVMDPLPALKEKLAGRKRPTVAVIVTEEHFARRRPRPAVDPAVETEIKRVLRECGFEIKDVKENELADWARLLDKRNVDAWPRGLQDVDIVITGEAFSEFAARIGNLISCSARAEINGIARRNGKIILAERDTTRAVDLSENIAGKTALQKAGRRLAIKVLEYFAEERSPTPAKP
jgi:TolB-like protein